MSVSKLSSGRWRAQVYDPRVGRNVSVRKVLPNEQSSYPTKTAAKQARARARDTLQDRVENGTTLREWWDRWINDPLFARPKKSTMELYVNQTRPFIEKHGHLPIHHISDLIASDWLRGGKRNNQIPALRVMFYDAASAKGGRLLSHNPFANLGVSRGAGRRNQTPPREQTVWSIVAAARELTSPDFAAWLQVAAFSGLRPSELDALSVDRIDFDASRIHVVEKYDSKTKEFTLPKNGLIREAPLTRPAREALVSLPLAAREPVEIEGQVRRFAFVNLQGKHWTASGRTYHWNAVRAAAGWKASLYLATRHFAGWYMVNELGMASEDVAIALGHEDGGDLVRRLYGHRDRRKALDRVVAAYETTVAAGQLDNVVELRRRGGESA